MKRCVVLAGTLLFAAGTLGAILAVLERPRGARLVETRDGESRSPGRRIDATLQEPSADRSDSEESAGRSDRRASAETAVRAPSANEDRAFLTVRVVASETGRVLENVNVAVVPATGASFAIADGGGDASFDPNRSLSNADGLAEFTIPAHTHCLASAYGVSLGEAIYPGSAWEEVRSLAPREQFMVTIAVPTRPDVTFVGQLLDSADNSWISGAKVTLLDGSMTFLAELIQDPSLCFAFEPRELSASTPRWMTVESDGAGFFELHIASWIVLDERRASFVRIEAPSYSPVRVCLESGHETSETAAPIHLTRSASIVASVRDEFGQAAPGIDVRVVLQHKNGRAALEASRELDWEARTNAMGVCNFADLPARVPLRVELFIQGRFVPQSDRPLVLTPGEERCIDLRFGD